ncbi:MAG: baseplate J/gp47 family protein [Fusobacterium gastrosuis]|uniref:baseplate J/gp47 family protein n=1 Tax=Fusobacterium gastrosuis TaxID=1755100 RepID=UPI002A8C88F8|nr:baseplate J/gp47 family protein [Fusobacterium gastrosuis]
MTTIDKIITDKGFIVPTFEEIYNRKLDSFKTVKPNIRETDSNLIISYLKFDAIEEYDSYMQGLSIFNNLSVYTATDNYLNAITGHLNMTWLEAKKSIGKVKITADNGTIIPQAWGVETKAGIQFVTLNTEPITITNNFVEVDVISLQAGKINNVRENEITEQTEILTGVKSINNAMPTLGGVDKETDTELRERYLKRIDRKTSFTTEGIKNYILNNSNVIKCQVIENDTDNNDSEGRLPHSYECICLGDTDENIFKVLYEYKLAGIRTVGDIKKDIKGVSIGFSRPVQANLDFEINITAIKDIWKEEFKNIIKNVIQTYIDKLEPQDIIYSYVLLGEIYKNVSGIKTIDIKIKKTGTSQKFTDYQLNRKEIAILKNVLINASVSL